MTTTPCSGNACSGNACSLNQLFINMAAAMAAQTETVRLWHLEGDAGEIPAKDAPLRDFLAEVLSQHLCNFRLWHIEDEARRVDVGPNVIADCKRRIDRLNQQRNDGMERVDACLLAMLGPHLPKESANRINTEPPGMAIDRLSILSLKIWHMAEQAERTDVSAEHVAACMAKLETLTTQRNELACALRELVQDYLDGTKRPRLYFQCKMYNDPSLNPQLYKNKGSAE